MLGILTERLEIELTESVLFDGTEQAIDLINQPKVMGIKVALDDFGTGFSSLSYMRDRPIPKVKLDRAFIKGITTNSCNAATEQGFITMAHQLNFVVVAESNENHDQQPNLIHRHCDLLQGFLFASLCRKRLLLPCQSCYLCPKYDLSLQQPGYVRWSWLRKGPDQRGCKDVQK